MACGIQGIYGGYIGDNGKEHGHDYHGAYYSYS